MGERIPNDWTATRFALPGWRKQWRVAAGVLLSGTVSQVVALLAMRSLTHGSSRPYPATRVLEDFAWMVPAYVTAWILPAAVAVHVERERSSGRWEAAALSRVTNGDLWLSVILPPALPWFVVAAGLSWVCLWSWEDGFAPMAFDATENLLSGVLFGALGAICGFRARSVRQAAGLTVASIAGFCYFGDVLHLAALGIQKPFVIAFMWSSGDFGVIALRSPNVALFNALCSNLPLVGDPWRDWLSAGVFAALASILGAMSFWVVCHARRPYR